MPNEFESFDDWCRKMESSTDYLRMENLQAGMAYSIWGRNAYVGVWMPQHQGFLISRYKLSLKPFLCIEYHWDIGEPQGTAKPLRPLACCPLVLPTEITDRDAEQNQELCAWLDALETRHPPSPGLDTVEERRQAAARWQLRQAEMRHPDTKRHARTVWKMNLLGLTQNWFLAPSPLVGEGWGEGAAVSAKTDAYADFLTLSPTLPRQGGERSEGAELNPLAA